MCRHQYTTVLCGVVLPSCARPQNRTHHPPPLAAHHRERNSISSLLPNRQNGFQFIKWAKSDFFFHALVVIQYFLFLHPLFGCWESVVGRKFAISMSPHSSYLVIGHSATWLSAGALHAHWISVTRYHTTDGLVFRMNVYVIWMEWIKRQKFIANLTEDKQVGEKVYVISIVTVDGRLIFKQNKRKLINNLNFIHSQFFVPLCWFPLLYSVYALNAVTVAVSRSPFPLSLSAHFLFRSSSECFSFIASFVDIVHLSPRQPWIIYLEMKTKLYRVTVAHPSEVAQNSVGGAWRLKTAIAPPVTRNRKG